MYKGLPITTNKITLEESKGIRHHLLGCIGLGEEPWTVRQFNAQATSEVEEIRSRGKLPILVGGTHYYTQSLLFPNTLIEDEHHEFLANREEARRWPILEASTEEMLQELRRVDPEMANRWHPKDRRKIRRSLEIWLLNGEPASEIYSKQQDECHAIESEEPDVRNSRTLRSNGPLVFWTHTSSAELNARLEKRVDDMLSRGLIEEIQSMHDFMQSQKQRGMMVDEGHGVWVAIGYKEFLPYLKDGRRAETLKQEAIERTKIATRQYAKRQNRWVRLKLLKAMREAGLMGNMFLLDTSDLSKWTSNVEAPAQNVTAAFLDGASLPLPETLSPIAQEMLAMEDKPSRSAQHCKVCDKTLMSEVEWSRHLKSKGHRRVTKPKIDWQALYPKTRAELV